jgi:predicted nucleotidyltransferase
MFLLGTKNNSGFPVRLKGEKMKAVGVIVEYNPFHNGHKFHLDQTKEQSGADIVIAVMSGNFLQRGEPALVSKWARTEMALHGGADIVFELPYFFATQNADIFATGAVSLLAAANCHSLCFGSEAGDIHTFTETLHFLSKKNDEFQDKIKEFSSQGVSYPKALSLSFEALSPDKHLLDLSKPNNILGLQYVAAIQQHHFTIQPLTITRKNANYHDEHFASSSIASATSIRKSLFSENGSIEGIHSYLPQTTYDLLHNYKQEYRQFHSWEDYWHLLRYKLLLTSSEELREIHEVEEGLENRLQHAVLHADSFLEFMEQIKTKRYTWTRLQRVCLHILMNVKKAEMANKRHPEYLRLLGMSPNGREYLRKEKKNLHLPLISKLSANKQLLELDLRASRLYALGVKGKKEQKRLLSLEFKQPPIQI